MLSAEVCCTHRNFLLREPVQSHMSPLQISHRHAIRSQLLKTSLEIIIVWVAVPCDPTMCARLYVDVEGWPIRVRRHRVTQAEHDPAPESDLEELQQDRTLYVSWQVALRSASLVVHPIV